ncbi:hypothetical protein [Butyricimonas sp. DFI.6.44]|nr:hypothetical protein [Butyricimonas sp. DFI.6.44]
MTLQKEKGGMPPSKKITPMTYPYHTYNLHENRDNPVSIPVHFCVKRY